jgi:hypothetical protein
MGKEREVLIKILTIIVFFLSLVRNKVCAYWLPATQKVIPETGAILQHHLQENLEAKRDKSATERSSLLFAWVSVCRNIRTSGELDLMSLVRTAFAIIADIDLCHHYLQYYLFIVIVVIFCLAWFMFTVSIM